MSNKFTFPNLPDKFNSPDWDASGTADQNVHPFSLQVGQTSVTELRLLVMQSIYNCPGVQGGLQVSTNLSLKVQVVPLLSNDHP